MPERSDGGEDGIDAEAKRGYPRPAAPGWHRWLARIGVSPGKGGLQRGCGCDCRSSELIEPASSSHEGFLPHLACGIASPNGPAVQMRRTRKEDLDASQRSAHPAMAAASAVGVVPRRHA